VAKLQLTLTIQKVEAAEKEFRSVAPAAFPNMSWQLGHLVRERVLKQSSCWVLTQMLLGFQLPAAVQS